MKEERAGNRWPKTRPLTDGEVGKSVPNSLVSVLRVIRQRWGVSGAKDRTVDTFTKVFEHYFHASRKRYPGDADIEIKHVDQALERLERGEDEIRYCHVRAFADYVGVPAGLLMLYSHVIGHAKKDFTKNDLTCFLDSSIAGLSALKTYVERVDETKPDALKALFWQLSPHPTERWMRYKAKAPGLEIMEAAFRQRLAECAPGREDIIG